MHFSILYALASLSSVYGGASVYSNAIGPVGDIHLTNKQVRSNPSLGKRRISHAHLAQGFPRWILAQVCLILPIPAASKYRRPASSIVINGVFPAPLIKGYKVSRSHCVVRIGPHMPYSREVSVEPLVSPWSLSYVLIQIRSNST